MKNEQITNGHKQISQIILRLEVDDLTNSINNTQLNSDKRTVNSSNPNIHQDFNFNSQPYSVSKLDKDIGQPLPSNHQLFRGHREARTWSIETYYFNNKAPTHMHQEVSKSEITTPNQQLVDNALTMQKALETAYNDWNRQKSSEKQKSQSEKSVNEDVVENKSGYEDKQKNECQQVSSSGSVKGDGNSAEQQSCLTSSIDANSSVINSVEATSEIAYYYGNPTVDLVKGFIHIYKDCNLKTFDEDTILNGNEQDLDTIQLTQPRSSMLCMIGVPNSLSCNELLDFVMPFNDHIQFMRILRDTFPNQYMVLFKFKNQKDADFFYLHNNNKPFNSIENNHCHLAFVERVETIDSSKGASQPIPGFTELPACYICLERMDESLTGVISILCNHSFHTNCLVKWGDTCCPVCRYSQTPDYTDVDNACTECGNHENLWICLICGFIGCGRYAGGHAHNHFKETQHTYSMELGNNKVWDYAADNYVHRLIQNKADGKLVQFDESSRTVNRDEKVDSITLEYTYLLTMQLDSQRLFFEDKLNKMEEKAQFQLDEIEIKWTENSNENDKLKENLQQTVKEKNNLDKKFSTLTTKYNKLQSELNEEKELNKCLTANQELYQTKLSTMEEKLKSFEQCKNKEIEELQSQLRDVMFYLDAQSKMSNSSDVTGEEIQASQMVIQQDEAAASTSSAPKLSNSAKMASRRKRK